MKARPTFLSAHATGTRKMCQTHWTLCVEETQRKSEFPKGLVPPKNQDLKAEKSCFFSPPNQEGKHLHHVPSKH